MQRFIEYASIEIIPVDTEQGRLAHTAWTQYGKGRHRAGLNFGDCFAYALASQCAQALLCKGNDFSHTDISIAVCV